MAEFLLCHVEDTFQITGRGLIIVPGFPASQYRFEANQRVRVVPATGGSFECDAYFQIPFQSPPPSVPSFLCALLGVSKQDVPVGSQIWLLDQSKEVVRRI